MYSKEAVAAAEMIMHLNTEAKLALAAYLRNICERAAEGRSYAYEDFDQMQHIAAMLTVNQPATVAIFPANT